MRSHLPPRPPRVPGRLARACALVVVGVVLGCDGPASTLDPAGRDAELIADLWWWMAAGAAVVWLLVIGLAVYALRVQPDRHDERWARRLVIGGGAIFPTVVLGGLLGYGLSIMPDLLQPAPEDGLRIEVSGERWWWRVRYVPPDGEPFTLANEIRLPLGERVQFELVSPDVIHAFWIPSLGGKIDMIPGRLNRLALTPTRTGVFRGECAEYCGLSHALMHFAVVVDEPADWAAWAEEQRAPVAPDAEGQGLELFLQNGCGACHTIRGTPADGEIGPDLTHVGGRETLAAGVLENDVEAYVAWLRDPQAIKPGAEMPAYGMLPDAELLALARWLDGLR